MGLVTLNEKGDLVDWQSFNVRKSQGVQITLFRQLLFKLAELAVQNPDHAILLRGQGDDHRNHEGTYINPTAFRQGMGDAITIENKINKAQKLLCAAVQRDGAFPNDVRVALENPLVAQALLQHYEVVPTPWLDLTDLPHIAVYFAPLNSPAATIYAFAIPRNRVLYSLQDPPTGLVCWSLACLCPAPAPRPYYQRAFVLADIRDGFPSLSSFAPDLSRHLLCKFQLEPSQVLAEMQQNFGAPQGAGIYPADYADPMLKIFRDVKRQMAAA